MPTLWWGLNLSIRWRTRKDAEGKKAWVVSLALYLVSIYLPIIYLYCEVYTYIHTAHTHICIYRYVLSLQIHCTCSMSWEAAMYRLHQWPVPSHFWLGLVRGERRLRWSLGHPRLLLCEYLVLGSSTCSCPSPFGCGMVTVPPLLVVQGYSMVTLWFSWLLPTLLSIIYFNKHTPWISLIWVYLFKLGNW